MTLEDEEGCWTEKTRGGGAGQCALRHLLLSAAHDPYCAACLKRTSQTSTQVPLLSPSYTPTLSPLHPHSSRPRSVLSTHCNFKIACSHNSWWGGGFLDGNVLDSKRGVSGWMWGGREGRLQEGWLHMVLSDENLEVKNVEAKGASVCWTKLASLPRWISIAPSLQS